MMIVDGADECVRPRNVGLLFFNEAPHKSLGGAQIDVVVFPKGAGGGEIVEKIFRGPLHEQIRSSLRYIKNEVIRERVLKVKDQAKAIRTANYPFVAIEEALVNAVYHRSYEQSEPVEVRVHPNRIEIVSYPGPDASISLDDLASGNVVARRYRNRRIGDFLKELNLTEGRCTGIPTIKKEMAKNGSPQPEFKTDENRTYFFVKLLVHEDLLGIQRKDASVTTDLSGQQEKVIEVLRFLNESGEKRKAEIAERLGMTARGGALRRVLDFLFESKLVEFTVPDKPSSSNQRYRITQKGLDALKKP